MAHVFISYAHVDGDFIITQLIPCLQDKGIVAWLDTERLRAGDDWRQGIDNAIKSSFSLIAVMTPDSSESKYVTYEWAYALGVNIPVLPIMLKPTVLHPRLEALHYLDFNDATLRPWDRLISQLKELYEQMIGRTNEPSKEQRVNELIEQLIVGEANEQAQAAKGLGVTKSAAAIPALVIALHDDSWLVVRAAALALGQIGEPSTVRDLVETLNTWGSRNSTYPEVVRAIISALENIATSEALSAVEQWRREQESNG